LVPVGDDTALAKAVRSVLDESPDRESLMQGIGVLRRAIAGHYLEAILAP
jgi:hypothetical protein